MHTMWKGSISFGLVNIPIKMFAATESKDVRFRYIHKTCNTPVKYKKVCPTCNEEVKEEDIVKGFEYEPGRFVIITNEDLESVKSEVNGKTIEIVDFVKLSEIDPIYFNKTYYLAPQDTVGKAYKLLRKAMDDTEKIAIARITIRNKQSLAALRVLKNVLVMETIFYPDEVRPISQVPGLPEDENVNEGELTIANQLIDQLTAAFDPSKYKDDYREAMLDLINKKIAGQDVQVTKEAPERNVIDLMEALQASLQQAKPQKGKPEKSTAKEKKKKTTGKQTG
ncbi:Ku protein [Vallitalea pronyensis]|uniref:Non-homologous end joining protein Ku n=2 Tax=Vallitalea pronyensis TaxID=1348613 RepID=A0A8J8ML97_9FIRM|nr:Ku protein [Vallitalea pronyensis]QUI23596.1 Ku protein [Vallitalea pronyensis]